MSEWEIAAAALVASLPLCLGVCALAGAANALVALELASTLTITVLMVLAEGFHRQPFIDLAVTLAFASLAGTIVLARLLPHR